MADTEALPATRQGMAMVPRTYDAMELDIEALIFRREKVQELMSRVLKDGVHFGKLPGIDRPCLFKPGAEALAFTFRFTPRYELKTTNFDNCHREVETRCSLYASDGSLLGDATAIASTMEAKYRWRKQYNEEDVGLVPKEYWDIDRDNVKARATLLVEKYGPGKYATRKIENAWHIMKRIGDDTRTENPDIADTWNTVAKMSQKRAFLAVVLAACGVSDMFTQDAEDGEDELDARTGGAPGKQGGSGTGSGGKQPDKKTDPGKGKPKDELYQSLTDRMSVASKSGLLTGKEYDAFTERFRSFRENDPGWKQYSAMVVEVEELIRLRREQEQGEKKA